MVRRDFFKQPERLQHVWTLTKGWRTTTCDVWSHEFGYELRLTVSGDSLPRTQVCRSTEELVMFQEIWRNAFEKQGWNPSRS